MKPSSRPRSLAAYALCKIAVLESVIEGGLSVAAAALKHGASASGAWRWVASHHRGETTLSSLRAEPFKRQQKNGSHHFTNVQPTAALRQVIASMPCDVSSPTLLLQATAPYVLHADAPIDHFIAWLQFAAREIDFN